MKHNTVYVAALAFFVIAIVFLSQSAIVAGQENGNTNLRQLITTLVERTNTDPSFEFLIQAGAQQNQGTQSFIGSRTGIVVTDIADDHVCVNDPNGFYSGPSGPSAVICIPYSNIQFIGYPNQ